MSKEKKKQKSIVDKLTYAYIRKIKKWMYCPDCQIGKMIIDSKSTIWICKECGYKLSANDFEDDYVFWFCDECSTYLNNQEGFDNQSTKHICLKCGYENDITFNNVKGICMDCGKVIPDTDVSLCNNCRQIRKEKAKEWILAAGKVAGVVATVAGTAYLASKATEEVDASDGLFFYTNDVMSKFNDITDSWIHTASEDGLREVESEMRLELEKLDYNSDEYLQLDLKRIDIVNEIASRFPLNLPKREHGRYLPNDDE